MLPDHAKNNSGPKERLRDFILNDAARRERLRTRESELIVIKESRQQRKVDDRKEKAAAHAG